MRECEIILNTRIVLRGYDGNRDIVFVRFYCKIVVGFLIVIFTGILCGNITIYRSTIVF